MKDLKGVNEMSVEFVKSPQKSHKSKGLYLWWTGVGLERIINGLSIFVAFQTAAGKLGIKEKVLRKFQRMHISYKQASLTFI